MDLCCPVLAGLTDSLLLIATVSVGCTVMQHAAFSLIGDVINFVRFLVAPMV